MGLIDRKIAAFKTTLSSRPNRERNQGTNIKATIDSMPEELRVSLNGVVDDVINDYTTKSEITNSRKLSATGNFTGTWGNETKQQIDTKIATANANSTAAVDTANENKARQDLLQVTFDQMIIDAGSSNAEIVAARVKEDGTSFASLPDRLNNVDSQLSDIPNQVYIIEKAKTVDVNNALALKADKTEVNTLATDKATKVEVEVERQRIDSFTTLAQGSTTGDAELIDGRIGTDGITYANIGSAIRNQFGKIGEIVSDNTIIHAKLSKNINDILNISYNAISYATRTTGKYVDKTGAIMTTDSNWYIEEYTNLISGREYLVKGITAYNSAAMYALYNGTTLLKVGTVNNGNPTYIEKLISIPDKTTKVVISGYYPSGTVAGVKDVKLEVTSIKKSLIGVKWAAIGDSLTDKSTLGTGVNNYVDFITTELGLTTQNIGMGGKGYVAGAVASQSFKDNIANSMDTGTNVATIFGSFNDMYVTWETGNVSDTDASSLYGAINATISAIYNKNPDCKIGIITPTPWSIFNTYNSSTDATKAINYVNALKNAANRWGIPVLDLFSCSGLRPWNTSFRTGRYLNDDGTHPLSNIHKLYITPHVLEFIKTLIYSL